MKNKRGNILVIFLALALVFSTVAIGYLFVQNKQLQNQKVQPVLPIQNPSSTNNFPTPVPAPTVDPTANWKTFTNDKFGYSFKYPSDWEVIRAMNTWTQVQLSRKISETEARQKNLPNSGGFFVVDVSINYNKFTRPDTTPSSSWITEVTNLTVSGVQANKYRTTFTQSIRPGVNPGDGETTVMMSHNGIDFALLLRDNRYQDIFDQILSTFKFI